jgi:hypothetical protein
MISLSAHREQKIKELEAANTGKGAKKAIVQAYYKEHKDMPMSVMAKQLGMPQATIRYAIMSLNGTFKQASTSKRIVKVPDNTSGEDYKKANEVDAFCPKCGKAVKAHICAVELHNEKYKHNVIGKCCATTFSYILD